MRFRYDKSSKWLIEHHAGAILKLAGLSDIASWTPVQAELVQPRQLPDGLVLAASRCATVQRFAKAMRQILRPGGTQR